MSKVIIYSTKVCPYCVRAKMLLDRKQVSYQEIFVDEDPQMRQHMEKISGRRTVPQIFIDGHHVGGCDDLYALESQGQLDKLLQQQQED